MFVKTDAEEVYNLSLYQRLSIIHVPQESRPYAIIATMPDCDNDKDGHLITLSHHATYNEASTVLGSLVIHSRGVIFSPKNEKFRISLY